MEIIDQEPELEKTTNIYGLPISDDTIIQGLVYESESHSGPSRGAIDIAVDLDTPILAPLNGLVTFVEDSNYQHGPTAEFAKYNNLIGIRHDNGEYSRLSHVAQSSSLVKVGDEVNAGQQVGKVGLVGATTRPHLHWMVSKHIQEKPGYQSLKIQLKQPFDMTKNKVGNAEAKEFYELTKGVPPSKTLAEAVKLLEHSGTALDLGCGAGRDTKYLLDQGLTVTAVDKDIQIQQYLKNLPQDHLSVVTSSFGKFKFGKYDLINAQNSLSFTDKEHFSELMQRLKGSLNQGGIFVGTLFGNHDEWNTADSRMSFVTRSQAEELFADMKVVKFEERDYDGNLANGAPKHWHIFYITAQK